MPSRPPSILPACRFHVPPSHLRSSFHTSTPTPAAAEPLASHYETLNLAESTTSADIKKRFYELSKSHHPDRNPNDPHASTKFIKISNAYSVLGNQKLRERYDRDLQRLRPTTGPRGTSSNPVGGRPASGLSRRRTQPQGPPPSFYRNGGWSRFRERQRTGQTTGSGFNGGVGGMGVGSDGGADHHDVPHFNWDGKYRQHERHEERRRSRTQSTGQGVDPGAIIPTVAVSFILICTVGTAAFGIPRRQEEELKRKGKQL